MASLYTIEQELLALFQVIEDNDGEITDEQFDLLKIKQDELAKKLTNYHQALQSWKADVDSCRDEEKRIASVRRTRENRIERLKLAMFEAVNKFGQDGKSGNKIYELPTVKFFTKGTQAVDVDDDRVSILIAQFESYIRELVSNDILFTGNEVDLTSILDVINTNTRAQFGEDYELFTLSDLTSIRLTVSITKSIYEYFRTGAEALVMYANNPIEVELRNSTSKDDWKGSINASVVAEVSPVTVAELKKNYHLQMR